MQEQKEKVAFVTSGMNLSHDTVAANPELLMASLPNRLGPRWECLQQLGSYGAIDYTDACEVIYLGARMTDSNLCATHTTPHLPVYDEQFQQEWQVRMGILPVQYTA